MYFDVYSSPLGILTLTAEDNMLTGLTLREQPPENAHFAPSLPVFRQAKVWLDAYFRSEVLPPLPPLAPKGTAFQKRVWGFLPRIPRGQTLTYGELARALAEPGRNPPAAQAVGQALVRNPIWILVPCHRVLGAGGKLTGYAGGVDAKLWLLRHEGCQDVKPTTKGGSL